MLSHDTTTAVTEQAPDHTFYEIAKDFAGPTVTLLVALFTVLYAFKQIRSQHRNTINAQKEETKRKTKIETFKELDALLNSTSTSVRRVNTHSMVHKYSPQSTDTKQIFDNEYAITQELIQELLTVVSKVESLEIIDQSLFRVFRYSIQSVVHDLSHLHELADREQRLDRLIEVTDTALSYSSDFQICLQNTAYGDVFGSSIQHRDPPDKSRKVITNNKNDLEVLENYFLKETEWGKEIQKWEEYAKEKYKS